jgi:hypothetical protein
MNRRVLIRNLSYAFAGSAVAGSLIRDASADAASYSIVTSDSAELLRYLRRTGLDLAGEYSVSTVPIPPSRQDLAVVKSGMVIEPEKLDGWEAQLIDHLRSTIEPGDQLVTVERRSPELSEVVEFRVDGIVVDQITLARDYRQIVIEGRQGPTVFSISDGRVAATSSSCRHGMCARCGSLRAGRIVCAPNRLVATVAGGSSTYDAVAG